MLDFWKTGPDGIPTGPFNSDPEAGLNFTFNTAAWLAASGVALTLDQAGSSIEVDAPLVRAGVVSYSGAAMTARIEYAPDAEVTPGQLVRMVVTMRASDGQHDARIYRLQLRPRYG